MVALLVPLLVFLVLAIYKIHRPGLYYDEMFVISPAFKVPAYRTWFRVPLQISPYVGAEKAWIYPPIFALFGVSALSIRLPAILISCGTLVLGYSLVRRILSPGWALAFSIACAVHPAFIFLTKVDWGPQVIMLLLKALCLLLCFRWLDGTTKTCWSVLGLWVLGFLDKFNFVWFVIALVIATCAIYRDVILRKVKTLRPPVLVGAAIATRSGRPVHIVDHLSFAEKAGNFRPFGSASSDLATLSIYLHGVSHSLHVVQVGPSFSLLDRMECHRLDHHLPHPGSRGLFRKWKFGEQGRSSHTAILPLVSLDVRDRLSGNCADAASWRGTPHHHVVPI